MQSDRKVRKLAAEELFEYAVKYLSVQASSSENLKFRLRRRAANFADVETVLARLKDIGYLDDRRFAESYAANRISNEGFGRMRVLADLRARRVSPKLAETAVEKAFEEVDEAELIDSFITRRLPSIAAGGPVEDERKLAAAYRRLRRAGFGAGPSLAALKRFAAHAETIDEPAPEDDEEISDADRFDS